MYNVKNVIRTNSQNVELPSKPFADFLLELDEAGFVFDSATTTSSKTRGDKLILGTVGGDGYLDYKQPHVNFRLSDKLKLSGTTGPEILKECYGNYPVFFGESTIRATPEEIEDGEPETRKMSWVTIAPVGEYVPKKAGKIDVAALFGKTLAGMPPAK